MPASATARIRPNVYVEPPSSGASIRYQTSSISVNAKPTMHEAASTNRRGARSAGGLGFAASSVSPCPFPSRTTIFLPVQIARSAIPALNRQAAHRV